jgi:RNA polymerase sigma-70 factor, ECF subfamily
MIKSEVKNELELIRKLRLGDEAAFEILFHRYKKRVKGFVHKMLPSNICSDNVVQDVFIRIWINREKIDSTKCFSTFIFTIAKNIVLDELKAAVNNKIVFAENSELEMAMLPCDTTEASEEELDAVFCKLIQKIPERRRQIFSLSRIEGFSYKQIAQKLNISENTVDTQIRKSLQFLRQEFQNIL